MKTNRLVAAWLIFSSLLVYASISYAQTEHARKCAEDPACMDLNERARQQSSSGNLDEALQLYQQAYALHHDPSLLFNLARIHHKQSAYPLAIAHYQQFIESSEATSDQKQKAAEFRKQCQILLDEQSKLKPAEPPKIETPLPTEPHPKPTELAKPTVTKWWFWMIVSGIAVAGVTTGVLIGIKQPDPAYDRTVPSNTLEISF